MVVFQAVAWNGRDVDDKQYIITIYGRTDDGKSVAVSFKFYPYFYIDAGYDDMRPAIERKSLWGFQNSEKRRYIKREFNTLEDVRRFKYRYKTTYEANIDPVLRFMHRTDISSTGWIDTGKCCERSYNTTCSIDLFCTNWETLKPVQRDTIAPFRIMSLDIETFSSDGSFPRADVKDNVIFQIGMTTRVYGTDISEKVILCLGDTHLREADVFETERHLLERFAEYLRESDPDIITGWNIFGFDLEYIYKRLVLLGLGEDAFVWGRDKERCVKLVEKKLASSALGSNILKMVPIEGRFVFDLFHEIKREHKLDKYSLDFVSKHFLNDSKIDIKPKEMFQIFRDKDPVSLGRVAEYCLKDTELPHKLMKKLVTIETLIEMAKATWVPLSFLSERGQQIKVYSQLTRKARQLGFIVPTCIKLDDDVSYEGATVLEPQTGAYYSPITALDFASLYPSIMMAHNLCYSTLVMDPKYMNIPGVQYERYGQHVFAQNVPSLLPEILRELKDFRKKAKKDMALHEGTPLEAVFNGRQLAYKISMNSVYGFTGASKGMLPCVAIASTVTMRGRQMIQETKEYIEKNFEGAHVRYGDTDSVMVEFDMQGRIGQEALEYSWALGERASKECSTLFKSPNNLELEKVYCPYFLYSKKRYAAKMYEKKGDSVIFKKIDVKGLQVVRRDTCPYVRETCKKVLASILDSNDPSSAIEYARECARKLVSGNVDMNLLILTKQLGSEYKTSNHAHVAVRDKIKERDPGSEPKSGDRVQYVIVQGPKKARLFEKSEDPTWAQEHGIKLDYDYYFKNQLQGPVLDLLEPVIGDTDIFSQ